MNYPKMLFAWAGATVGQILPLLFQESSKNAQSAYVWPQWPHPSPIWLLHSSWINLRVALVNRVILSDIKWLRPVLQVGCPVIWPPLSLCQRGPEKAVEPQLHLLKHANMKLNVALFTWITKIWTWWQVISVVSSANLADEVLLFQIGI